MLTEIIIAGERGYIVSDEIKNSIRLLLQKEKICLSCEQSYRKKNPEVITNVCKNCFLRWQSQEYTFLGVLSEKNDHIRYGFYQPDEKRVYVTQIEAKTAFSYRLSTEHISIYWTLCHFQFHLPPFESTETKLSFYGDLEKHIALIACYEYQATREKLFYLLEKGGNYTPLRLDSGLGKKLFLQAKKALKNDSKQLVLSPATIYTKMSDIASFSR